MLNQTHVAKQMKVIVIYTHDCDIKNILANGFIRISAARLNSNVLGTISRAYDVTSHVLANGDN